MKNKINRVHCFVICLVVPLVWLLAACSPGTSTEVTPVSQPFLPTETTEPTMVITESTPTIAASTATVTPSITPTPTLPPLPSPTNTATSTPTVSHMQKLGELPIGGIAFPNLGVSADGTLLAVSAEDAEDTLYVFDTITQTIRWRIIEDDKGDLIGYSSLAFSADGHYLAGWNGGWTLFIWDMANGETIYQIGFSRAKNINSISFSPDGCLLAISSFDALIYSMATGEFVDSFPSSNIVTYPPTDGGDHFLKPGNHYGQIMDVEFVPSYTNLLALTVVSNPSAEGEGIVGGVYFWDMEKQHLRSVLPGIGGFRILVSPNGQLLVAEIDDQIVGWDIEDDHEVFAIENTEANADLISITDAGFFVTLSRTEGMNVRNLGGELVATLNPDVPVGDAVFLPDGRLLVAYLDENSPIEIWEITE